MKHMLLARYLSFDINYNIKALSSERKSQALHLANRAKSDIQDNQVLNKQCIKVPSKYLL